MKGGSKLFIFTGVALALVTVLLAITMTSSPQKGKSQDDDKPDKVKVIKAAADFEPHKVISMADIVIEEMSTDQVPPDAATDTAAVLGQSYKLGAVKGDILLNSYLQAPGITNSIEPGMRAISLQVGDQNMMSGLIMDGDYVDIVFQARVDLQRVLQVANSVEVEEDGPYVIKEVVPAPPGTDAGDAQQIQGADGSEFTVKDNGGNQEPVAKILVQDVKVLRVIAPGVKYDAQGQQVTESEIDTAASADKGQLVLQVTPQQAEALAFIQDGNSIDGNDKYEILVRGKEDHEIASTTGVTFQILMTNETWSLPYPQPVVAPEAASDDE